MKIENEWVWHRMTRSEGRKKELNNVQFSSFDFFSTGVFCAMELLCSSRAKWAQTDKLLQSQDFYFTKPREFLLFWRTNKQDRWKYKTIWSKNRVCVWVGFCVCVCFNVSVGVGVYVRVSVCVSGCVCLNVRWVWECVWVCVRLSMANCVSWCLCEWVCVWKSMGLSLCIGVCVTEWVCLRESVWVSEVCVCVRVSEYMCPEEKCHNDNSTFNHHSTTMMTTTTTTCYNYPYHSFECVCLSVCRESLCVLGLCGCLSWSVWLWVFWVCCVSVWMFEWMGVCVCVCECILCVYVCSCE